MVVTKDFGHLGLRYQIGLKLESMATHLYLRVLNLGKQLN